MWSSFGANVTLLPLWQNIYLHFPCARNMPNFWHSSLINYVSRELASEIPAQSLPMNHHPTTNSPHFLLPSQRLSPFLGSNLPTSQLCKGQNMRSQKNDTAGLG